MIYDLQKPSESETFRIVRINWTLNIEGQRVEGFMIYDL
jgi:hypothetical protein